MTFDLDLTGRIADMERRVGRLETLESGLSGGTGGFIEEFILDDNVTTEVIFNFIPQNFQHLILMISARAVGVDDSPLYLQVNGDTGNNYIWGYRIQATHFNNTNYGGNPPTDHMDIGDIPGCTAKSDLFSSWIGFIAHYHSTIKKTPLTWHSGGLWIGTWSDFKGSGIWNNNDGIDELRIYAAGNAFAQHSKFALYGQGVAA